MLSDREKLIVSIAIVGFFSVVKEEKIGTKEETDIKVANMIIQISKALKITDMETAELIRDIAHYNREELPDLQKLLYKKEYNGVE